MSKPVFAILAATAAGTSVVLALNAKAILPEPKPLYVPACPEGYTKVRAYQTPSVVCVVAIPTISANP